MAGLWLGGWLAGHWCQQPSRQRQPAFPAPKPHLESNLQPDSGPPVEQLGSQIMPSQPFAPIRTGC